MCRMVELDEEVMPVVGLGVFVLLYGARCAKYVQTWSTMGRVHADNAALTCARRQFPNWASTTLTD